MTQLSRDVDTLRSLLRPPYPRRTALTALGVGSVLFVVNHLAAVIDSRVSNGVWIATALSYVMPFCVANLGLFFALRHRSVPVHDDGANQSLRTGHASPTWQTVSQWPRCIAFSPHLRRTILTGLVVGSLYALVNHFSSLRSGDLTTGAWVEIFVTYLVPFSVSNVGVLIGCRQVEEREVPGQ